MDLQVYRVKGQGELRIERVLLHAKEAVDTWDYGIGKTHGDDANIYPVLDVFFMLPKINLLKGDFICIYTKNGVKDSFNINKRVKVNRVYMGLESPIWSDLDKVVVIKISDYRAVSVGDFTEQISST